MNLRLWWFLLVLMTVAACGGKQRKGTVGGATVSIGWAIEDLGEDPTTSNPMSRVLLVVNGERHDLGTFPGGCHPEAMTFPADAARGALTTAECYFAGGGDQWDVVQQGDELVVSHALTEEGDEDNEGGVLPFEEVKRIPIPAGAKVVVEEVATATVP